MPLGAFQLLKWGPRFLRHSSCSGGVLNVTIIDWCYCWFEGCAGQRRICCHVGCSCSGVWSWCLLCAVLCCAVLCCAGIIAIVGAGSEVWWSTIWFMGDGRRRGVAIWRRCDLSLKVHTIYNLWSVLGFGSFYWALFLCLLGTYHTYLRTVR